MRPRHAEGPSVLRWRLAAGVSVFALLTISLLYVSQSSFDLLGFLGIAQVLIILMYLSVSATAKGFRPPSPLAGGRRQLLSKIAVLGAGGWMITTALIFLLTDAWRAYGILSLCISVVFLSAAYPTPLTIWRVSLIGVSLVGGLIYAFVLDLL